LVIKFLLLSPEAFPGDSFRLSESFRSLYDPAHRETPFYASARKVFVPETTAI
jgi:hypothetical protein